MNEIICIRTALQNYPELSVKEITVVGWVRSSRKQKNLAFVSLYDGSTFSELQIIIPTQLYTTDITTGACIKATGKLVESIGKSQSIELKASAVEVIGISDPSSFPLQKKAHSMEFLRSIGHLRSKSKTFSAIFRIRHCIAEATHKFFSDKQFQYIQTPIITGMDCEGGGDVFEVHTSDNENKFFGQNVFLTVSGQLNAEAICAGLGSVYTFGPTFRAEYSTTTKHLSEFWMIEPEIAFCNLEELMNISEQYMKFLIKYTMTHRKEELQFCNDTIYPDLISELLSFVNEPFAKLSYTDAIKILENNNSSFEFPITWGDDLQTEHEKHICHTVTKLPTFIYNYPEPIKPFYMKRNSDNITVANMDLLFPRVGEIIGGSQREDVLGILQEKMQKSKMALSEYDWYLDLRRFGSFTHSGFGAGFERIVRVVTGVENIRDTIPFPRFPNSSNF